MKLCERDVTRQVRDFMQYRGWRAVRMQSALVQGAAQTFRVGEVGIPDYLFIHYLEGDGVTLSLWVEFKSPGDRDQCKCKVGGKKCRFCGQYAWQVLETKRGGRVWKVREFEPFEIAYKQAYGWLHHGASGIGQLTLLEKS